MLLCTDQHDPCTLDNSIMEKKRRENWETERERNDREDGWNERWRRGRKGKKVKRMVMRSERERVRIKEQMTKKHLKNRHF